MQGEETIGWSIGKEGLQPDKPYDTEKDFCLYGEVPGETLIRLAPGMFAVFFPEDIHRPGLCESAPGTIRKIVVKIDQELL